MLYSISTCLLALSASLSFASATLLADFNPAVNKSVTIADIGQVHPRGCPCPVDQPNCKSVQPEPSYSELFQVKNKRFVFNKPAKYDRAEVHGIKGHVFEEGKTYYLGWDFQISGFPPRVDCKGQDGACSVQSNRIFQYHTTGSPNTLNIPLQFIIPTGSKRVGFYGMYYLNESDPSQGRDFTPLWVSPELSTSSIYTVAMRITTARSSKGVVEFWWGGKQQELAPVRPNSGPKKLTINMQTWDGAHVDPKWGVYGAWSTALKTTMGRIRLGTTIGDVLY